jgi:hypothetical protein
VCGSATHSQERIAEARSHGITVLTECPSELPDLNADSAVQAEAQRSILRSVLGVAEKLHADAKLQIVASTHSPLVLASAEPVFDEETDKLFTLTMERGEVHLRVQPWAKQGDVVNWLVSDVFGLEQARSIEAERAIEAAEARKLAIATLYAEPGFFERTPPGDLKQLEREDAELGAKIDGWMTEWEEIEKELHELGFQTLRHRERDAVD